MVETWKPKPVAELDSEPRHSTCPESDAMEHGLWGETYGELLDFCWIG